MKKNKKVKEIEDEDFNETSLYWDLEKDEFPASHCPLARSFKAPNLRKTRSKIISER